MPSPADLRTPEVNAAVSSVAAMPAVRAFLLGHQRAQAVAARAGGFAGVVMEGRDIGSVVMPDAEVRIFLEADAAARERRRAAEGMKDPIDRRDRMDSTRSASPMVCPEGAVRIDNTALSLDEVVARVEALVVAAAGR
jgi:cytidylate kinase